MEAKLSELIVRCRDETARYGREGVSDSQPCWEIWRRAVVGQSGEAWEAVLDQYAQLVRRWLWGRLGAMPWLHQEEDFLLNATFAKFFRYVDGEKFHNFPSLAALLSYLQTCCSTAVIDEQRAYQARLGQVSLQSAVAGDQDDAQSDANFSPIAQLKSAEDLEQTVVARLDRREFWKQIALLIPDRIDQFLLQQMFVLGMPPREVAQLYPQYFADVNAVYKRRKSILLRLRNKIDLIEQL